MLSKDIHNRVAMLSVILAYSFLFLLLWKEVPKGNEQMINIFGACLIVGIPSGIAGYLYGSSKKQSEPEGKVTETTTVEKP